MMVKSNTNLQSAVCLFYGTSNTVAFYQVDGISLHVVYIVYIFLSVLTDYSHRNT